MIRRKVPFIRKSPKKAKKPKVKSISKLMREADRLFSIKVREKGAQNDTNHCFTCGNGFLIRHLQCGHYISRAVKCLRWEKNNCRPQCVGCNIFKKGNIIEFRINLVEDIGDVKVEEMESRRKESFKLTRPYLENLIKELSV